jgi:hypothetical protein
MIISTDKSESKRRIADLIRWSNQPADARMLVVESLGQMTKADLAFTCTYGRGTAFVLGDGTTLDKKDVESLPIVAEEDLTVDDPVASFLMSATSGYVNKSLLHVPEGAAPLNKIIEVGGTEIHIPCGVCVILGAANAGKTPLAHKLASSGVDSYSVVRAGEPFAGYQSNQNKIAKMLGEAIYASSDVVLDSVKDLMSGDGAAMKGGLSRGVLVDLSIWSALAASLGVTIYVPLNPSSTDPEVMAMMREAAVSNATMTIAHESGDSWSFISRKGEGLTRRVGTLKFLREDLDPKVDPQSRNKGNMQVKVVDDKLTEAVLQRVLRSQYK